MMFSSRRSRNRHSANPNPKLHTPHLRRKISPHDGRTHQGPFLPGIDFKPNLIKTMILFRNISTKFRLKLKSGKSYHWCKICCHNNSH